MANRVHFYKLWLTSCGRFLRWFIFFVDRRVLVECTFLRPYSLIGYILEIRGITYNMWGHLLEPFQNVVLLPLFIIIQLLTSFCSVNHNLFYLHLWNTTFILVLMLESCMGYWIFLRTLLWTLYLSDSYLVKDSYKVSNKVGNKSQ